MSSSVGEISIGIVTALAIECAAVRLVVDDLQRHPMRGDRNHYQVGSLPSVDSKHPHRVVVTVLPEDGTRNAAAICADLLRSFPTVRCVVMSGIAGGVPVRDAPDGDVRLGDVVVATKGLVDYDHVRTVDGEDQLRRAIDGLSRDLLRAEHELEVKEYSGARPWEEWLGTPERPVPPLFTRPPDDVNSPHCWGQRIVGRPRIHRSAIGSADRLLRDAVRRDEIARRHHVRAVEMESSGVAVGSALHSIHWFVVRGVADYCDNTHKDDLWHPYASLAAAAYVRALLAECHPFSEDLRSHRLSGYSEDLSIEDLIEIVDVLLDIEQLRDDYDRRAVLRQLPGDIRTAIPDNVRGRMHLVATVRTCARFLADGKRALLDALRTAVPEGSAELRRAESTIEARWPRGRSPTNRSSGGR